MNYNKRYTDRESGTFKSLKKIINTKANKKHGCIKVVKKENGMSKEVFEQFQKSWDNFNSQDNEGYIPNRGDFKAGWFTCWNYREKEISKINKEIDLLNLRLLETNNLLVKNLMDKIGKLEE